MIKFSVIELIETISSVFQKDEEQRRTITALLSLFFSYYVKYNQEEQLYNAISYSDIQKCQFSVRIFYHMIPDDKKELFDLFEKAINELI